MKLTILFLLSCTATALFNPNLLPRQAAPSSSISAPSFPSLTLTSPPGTAFTPTGTGTGIPHPHSHGTRPRPSASHHSAGLPHHSSRGNVARQYPSVTASSLGTISSAGPVNGTRTSFRGGPTGGRHSTRRPRPTGTGTLTGSGSGASTSFAA